MTREEILEQIDKLETRLFYIEMEDFMDWKRYYSIKDEIKALKEKLEA